MKVSVLIPMYNAEEYISATIDNVLKQTYSDIEVIVVDDGSTDKSYEIAQAYQSDVVKVFRQENKGASAARNFAFQQSSGDLIQYLDADDLLSYNKIESQVHLFKSINDKKAVITSGIILFEGDLMSSLMIPHKQVSTNGYNKPLDFLIDICCERNIVQSSIWLVHRDLIAETGRWNEQLSLNDDGEYFFRVVAKSSAVYFCPQGAVFYRNTPQSLSKQVSDKAVKSQLTATRIMVKEMIALEDSKRVKSAAVNFYMQYLTRFKSEFYNREAANDVKKLGYNINTFKKSRLHRMFYAILGDNLAKKVSRKLH